MGAQHKAWFQVLEYLFIFLTAPLLWAGFVIAMLTIYVPMYGVRLLVQRLARKLHPDWDEIMRDKDTVVGADNVLESPQGVLVFYNVVQGRVDLARFQARFYEDLILHRDPVTGAFPNKKLQQYTEGWWGYNFWKWDKDFKIENHIRILEGTEGRALTTENQFLELMGPLMTKPFPAKRSYWEVLIVNDYVPKYCSKGGLGTPRSMVVFRMHHGIGDGFSFLKQIMKHICRDDLSHIIQVKSGSKPTLLRQLLTLGYFFVTMPYRFTRQFTDIDANPWFLPKSKLQRDCHVAMTKRISISQVKEIYKENGVSFATVLYSAFAGSINKVYQRKYAQNKIQCPEMMRCFTPFPWKNHPNNKLTNHWTCAVVKVFPGIDCPLERMRKTEAELNKLKICPAPIANFLTMPLVAALPIWAARIIGSNWFSTFILSNFPGPSNTVSYYAGDHDVEDSCFWAPHLSGSAGIGVTMMSYKDSIRFGLNFDKAILPKRSDVEEMCSLIEEEFEALLNLTKKPVPEKVQSDKPDENENDVSVNQINLRLRSVS